MGGYHENSCYTVIPAPAGIHLLPLQLDLDKQNISAYTLEGRQRRGSAGPLARTPMKRWNVLKHFGTRKRPAEYEMARTSYESGVPESLKSAHLVSRAFHSRP